MCPLHRSTCRPGQMSASLKKFCLIHFEKAMTAAFISGSTPASFLILSPCLAITYQIPSSSCDFASDTPSEMMLSIIFFSLSLKTGV